jgi:hypothetical protein
MTLSFICQSGESDVAPNLSGLTGEFYPEIDGRHWDKKLLKKWLKNPRDIKINAVMPVVNLTEKEIDEILKVFSKEYYE